MTSPSPKGGGTPAWRPLVGALLGGWVLALPALSGRAPVGRAVEWITREGFEPGFVHDADVLLVHGWVPLVGVSAAVLFLLPGLFLSAAGRRPATLPVHVLRGFVLSLPMVSVLGGLMGGLRGGAFGVATLGLATGCWIVWALRVRMTGRSALPRIEVREVAALLVVPLAFAALLAPKFLWESFNGDGVHAFESARLLLHQPVPFWAAESGAISSFPGTNSYVFTYPMSWYLRLVGSHEAGARLPLLLFMILLYSGVRAIGAAGTARPSRAAGSWLPWVGVVVFAWAMSFSATYNPYVTDIALPATQDVLAAACILGFLWALVERQAPWALAFGYLTVAGSPSGLLLVGLWLVARLAVTRPLPLRESVWTVSILLASMLVSAALPSLLSALGQPVPGGEHGLRVLLSRFENLQFTDVGRMLYVALPCGIVPALVIFDRRRQDDVAKAISLTAVAYFALFFVQAYVSLHQFFPAVALPLAVVWRGVVNGVEPGRLLSRGAIVGGGALALALQWPGTLDLDASGRMVGGSIEDRRGGYDAMAPGSFRASGLLSALFPPTWESEVPEEAYGGSPLIWHHYAHRDPLPGTERAYLLQDASTPAPPDGRPAGTLSGAALYVLSDSVLESHRGLRPRTPAGTPLLAVPRGVMFPGEVDMGATRVVSVRGVLASVASRTEALLQRLDGR